MRQQLKTLRAKTHIHKEEGMDRVKEIMRESGMRERVRSVERVSEREGVRKRGWSE